MSAMTFEQEAVLVSLRAMFKGSYFSICTVDNALAVLGIHPDPDDYRALNALHCVKFCQMPADFREQVVEKTLALFAGDPMPALEYSAKTGDVVVEKRRRFRALLGGSR